MRKIGLILAMVMFLLVPLSSEAASIALKAIWTANADTVTTGYKLYRTDGTRILIGAIPGKTTVQYLFTITVPDNSIGTATFVMTATSATKESGDSNTASYPFDLTPMPAVPAGLGIAIP
jgi:hypothetical protein